MPTAALNGTADGATKSSRKPKGGDVAILELPALDIRYVTLRIQGDSPLITHKWSEKAKKQMRDKQQNKATEGREAKDPVAEFEAAIYRLPSGAPAIRAISFKAAAVDAASQMKGSVTKVFLRGAFHVIGEFLEIQGSEPVMREDMVRVGMGTADLRYRPEFSEWYVDVPVRYNARVMSVEQLVHLFNTAGFSSGVGEWRPQKDGMNGLYHVSEVHHERG